MHGVCTGQFRRLQDPWYTEVAVLGVRWPNAKAAICGVDVRRVAIRVGEDLDRFNTQDTARSLDADGDLTAIRAQNPLQHRNHSSTGGPVTTLSETTPPQYRPGHRFPPKRRTQ